MVGKEPGWVTPEAVAEVMLGLVEKDEWVGGTIMETGKTVREVMGFDDPGPKGGGNNVENEMRVQDEMWEGLKRRFEGV